MPFSTFVLLEKIAGTGLTSRRLKSLLPSCARQGPVLSPLSPSSPIQGVEISLPSTEEDSLPSLSWSSSTSPPSLKVLPTPSPYPSARIPTSDLEAITCLNGHHSEQYWREMGQVFHGAREPRLHDHQCEEEGQGGRLLRRLGLRVRWKGARNVPAPAPLLGSKKVEVRPVRFVRDGEGAVESSGDEEEEGEEEEEGVFEMEDVSVVGDEGDWGDVVDEEEGRNERIDSGFEGSQEKIVDAVEWWKDFSFFNR